VAPMSAVNLDLACARAAISCSFCEAGDLDEIQKILGVLQQNGPYFAMLYCDAYLDDGQRCRLYPALKKLFGPCRVAAYGLGFWADAQIGTDRDNAHLPNLDVRVQSCSDVYQGLLMRQALQRFLVYLKLRARANKQEAEAQGREDARSAEGATEDRT
jgi:hypothetical protein